MGLTEKCLNFYRLGGLSDIEEDMTWKNYPKGSYKAVISSPQKETEGTATLPQEGVGGFVHEMISERRD